MSSSKLVFLAMLSAISFVLMWFGFPIIPIAPYLKFEPSDVPLIIATVAYGPLAGLMTLTVKNLLYFLLHGGNIFGIFMNFSASATFLCVTALFYRRLHFIISAGLGTVFMALIMIPLNVIVVPLQFGIPFAQVWALMLPVYIPFNLIKGCLNTALFLLIWPLIKKHGLVGKLTRTEDY